MHKIEVQALDNVHGYRRRTNREKMQTLKSLSCRQLAYIRRVDGKEDKEKTAYFSHPLQFNVVRMETLWVSSLFSLCVCIGLAVYCTV